MGLAGGAFDPIGYSSLSAATDSSWTDDLPICTATGVGFSPNQTYRRDGYRSAEHELEDQSFHFRNDDNISLYGVFDGHHGTQLASYAVQRMPAEILLGQLREDSTEKEIQEVLRDAFLSVEREWFSDIIGNKLAERATLLSEIQPGINMYTSFQDAQLRSQLDDLTRAVASGTTAVVVLIFYGKLFVSNVGDSRALLCCAEGDGILRVHQLSVDHDLNNDEEIRRLQSLGLDTNRLKSVMRVGNQTNTRCLGNYLVKGGYKECEELASARFEPAIPGIKDFYEVTSTLLKSVLLLVSDPTVHQAYPLDDTCKFLLLLSGGLYKALAEALNSQQVNSQLAEMVVEEFKIQSTLNGVAQAVVDRISRMHHDHHQVMMNQINKREDMTLLVRNFNFPLPKSKISSPINGKHPSSFPSSQVSTPTNNYQYDSNITPLPKIVLSGPNSHNNSTAVSENTNTEASTSTESSDLLANSIQKLPLDANGRIQPYVDFSDFYKAFGATTITPSATSSNVNNNTSILEHNNNDS